MIASDREIVMSRLFDAPRALVFRMWTRPEHVAWWGGPRGFSTTVQEMEVRPGGHLRFVMHGPDGTDYANEIAYRAVDAPNRIAYTHGPAPIFDFEVIFEDEGEKTRVTVRMTFESASMRDRAAQEFGAVEGLTQTLSRLGAVLAAHLGSTGTEPEIVVVREFDAPRERVFEANVDPERMMRWWGPHGSVNLACSIDLREGGSWSVDQEAFGGIHRFGGVYREIIRPERLVYTFEWRGAPGQIATVAATFEDLGGKTRLTSRTRLSTIAERDAMLSHGAVGGVQQSYERLDALLEEEQR